MAVPATPCRLVVKNLFKAFKKRQVVNDISLNLNSGEVVGLLGPNGAGKTTCFYMIVGLIPSDAGTILLNDKDITRDPMHLRARAGVGYLPQEASIFRKLSVADNILAVLQTRKDLSSVARKKRLESLLEELNIDRLRDNMGISLSGGERRRVEIARALALEPRFILLDEPFAGIDPISIIDVQNMIKQLLLRNIGVLITDHNVRETLSICSRAYIVYDGAILASGDAQNILDNQKVREIYLGAHFSL